jgi:ParB-like chromosome segregation protein Spo0J
MELEFHQLDLRHAHLRVRQPARERRLLASLADLGQQMPIVVVHGASPYVVVDGYKRVRCLHRLHRDTVTAVIWDLAEADALILRQLLQTDALDSVFEQGWLLHTLHHEQGLALDALARRFDRSVSWVSRRLDLVRTLPPTVQQHVREGRIVAHAAMKYLVPLARANGEACTQLADAVAPHRLTTRQIGRLYQAYVAGPAATHTLILTDPLLVLRLAEDGAPARVRPEASSPDALLTDFHVLGAVARRATRRLQHGGGVLPPERARAWHVFDQVQQDFHHLQRCCEQELRDDRPGPALSDSAVTGEGPRHSPDCARAPHRAGDGADGAAGGLADRAAGGPR